MDSILPVDIFLKSEQKPDREITSHWPSNASIIVDGKVIGSCLRKQYYTWTKEPKTNPLDTKSFFNFHMGHHFEEMYEGGLKVLGVEYKREHPVKLDVGLKYPLSGKIDFLIKEGDKWNAVELKTSFGRGISIVKKAGLPKEPYMLQMLCYLTYCDPKIDVCYNPTIARDSYYRLEFKAWLEDNKLIVNGQEIPYTMAGIIERWKQLEDYLEKKELPPRDFKEEKKYPCSYCAYRTKCFERGGE